MGSAHFSPALLRRFERQGRGLGTGRNYSPWHQVRPAEPASRGRSHLINWRFNRLHHLLSDNELVVFGLAAMLDPMDLREQYPLGLETHPLEVGAYDATFARPWAPGTLAIAKDLGIQHPTTRCKDEVAPWVMTTDLVITMRQPNGRCAILAIAVKDAKELERERTRKLLEIEREYWVRQEATWLLITPEMVGHETAETIKGCLPWALSSDMHCSDLLPQMSCMADALDGLTYPEALRYVARHLSVKQEAAQEIFWRGVWTGSVRLDLSVPLRPASRVRILSAEAFLAQNPVAMRSTAWLS